ncbi:MAG: hypothetical protein K2I81_04380 [Alphaproteobacteria bacterium]|nr:hypothetical protein [Alphaproteobacteria bacterium]
MREESGRSLIEIVGIMAIGAIMTVSAVSLYNVIRGNQIRAIASADLEALARDTRLLLGMRGDYSGVSVDYLIKAGALKSDRSPLGGPWSVTAAADGKTFSINLTQLSAGECDYFITATPKWASEIRVNGMPADTTADSCFSSRTNEISFIVE